MLKMLLNYGVNNSVDKHIYIIKLDMEKAFDRVNRTILWNKLWDMGIRGKFWRVLHNIYSKTWTQVKIGNQKTEPI